MNKDKSEFEEVVMKKTLLVKILLLIFYCTPFAFLSVNGDAVWGTMLFYGVMILGFGILCWIALKTNNTVILYIGNILSFISSYINAKLLGLEQMEYYFKPFTSYSLIAAISIAMLIIQTLILLIYKANKKKYMANIKQAS